MDTPEAVNTSDDNDHNRGLIAWFARNHVAANLLLVFICVLGFYAISVLKKETFPSFSLDMIEIGVSYPGAGPEEVETGILIKIEEALTSIQGIEELRAIAREGSGQVYASVDQGYELGEVTDQVKLAVDRIVTFPIDAERPYITQREEKVQALMVAVSGSIDEFTMANLVTQIREEIIALPEVTFADIQGRKDFEISIDISEQRLREYGLSLSQVAGVISRWSVDLPGGSIRTDGGNIRLRANGQAYTGEEFANIVLLTNPDGSKLLLKDVAEIRDGFVEQPGYAYFNGERAMMIEVKSTANESELKISEAVKRYIAAREKSLPDSVALDVWGDSTRFLSSQLTMLLKNMAMGFALVFVVLAVFLRLRLAVWVVVGLPVAFLGAFMLLPTVGVTINIMSLFAFILVLGIVVDDAIIVAESAHAETEKSGYSLKSIVVGTKKVALPATFGVLTTVAAFLPRLQVTGPPSAMIHALAYVVVFCLLFSLVESKLILPSHLALLPPPRSDKGRITEAVDRSLKAFIENKYKPFLAKAIDYRYTTVAVFVSMILLVAGFFAGGFVKYGFFPDVENPMLAVNVEVTEGSPEDLTGRISEQLAASLGELRQEVRTELGAEADFVENAFSWVWPEGTRYMVELKPNETLAVTPAEIENRWRAKFGDIAGVKEIKFFSKQRMGGETDIGFRMVGKNPQMLQQAAEELADYLRSMKGVYEVSSSYNEGPQELKLRVKESAEPTGLTLSDLARQVREAFFGAEAQRFQRGNDEIRVMVRYPREERRSIGDLEEMWVQLPAGAEAPFSSVAEYDLGQGRSQIQRLDKQRTIRVMANVDQQVLEPRSAVRKIRTDYLPSMLSRYPGVNMELDGSSKEEEEALGLLLLVAFLVLGSLYALLAIPLRSYLQPLIIMSVIPFGLIGAVVGHAVLDTTISMVSIIGCISLAGVVVNDSLIMVDFVNRKTREGLDYALASVEAGAERFRAIVLTSLTTFFGLLPIMFESSTQAQMILPMAVSLGFGILFSTIITLVLVPALYNILADLTKPKQPLPEVLAATAAP
ncbi:MAG: efflux RND transporter permease subunit [Pseudomonadota bacterium]|nr:efflux RND transporter permease subunit [Pseudomonadota bacterium]